MVMFVVEKDKNKMIKKNFQYVKKNNVNDIE